MEAFEAAGESDCSLAVRSCAALFRLRLRDCFTDGNISAADVEGQLLSESLSFPFVEEELLLLLKQEDGEDVEEELLSPTRGLSLASIKEPIYNTYSKKN